MYESFYGLKEKPFNITPDPDYLYMSQAHENAYIHLQYALEEHKGFVVITGEIGAGKTTLINLLLRNLPQDVHVGVINHANVLPLQFIKMICQELELEVTGLDKAEMLDNLHGFLLRQFAERKRVVLIIDEAQNLPEKTIEEIRMLSNLDAEKHHLIQMILVGQPELKSKLQQRELKQFAQRVTVYCHLRGLNKEEVTQYIHHRLQVAGSDNLEIFSKEAIEAVCQYSHGIPRMINILCDSALVYGYADDAKIIDKKVVDDVFKARTTRGLSYDAKDDKNGGDLSSLSLTEDPEKWEKRFEALERKINLLAGAVTKMNQALHAWTNKNSRRDMVIIELFKMLKLSMKRRKIIILEYKHLKEQMDTIKTRTSSSPS